jgi:serine/threonine-protein kinase
LRRYLRSRRILDVDQAVMVAHDVALGLGAAHRGGIVHSAVNPQHVLLGRDGSIKLTALSMMFLGGPNCAPEQFQGEMVTPATDVYALGILMYEMLTGRLPFDGDAPVAVAMQHIQDPPPPPTTYNPNIPPALQEIILRCLEKVPQMRYRDGWQLAQALEQGTRTTNIP